MLERRGARSRAQRVLAAGALCVVAASCSGGGSGGGGGGGGADRGPAAATDENVGAWADTALVFVVTDRCAGEQSVEMESPGGRLRFDAEPVAVTLGASPCRVEQAFDDAGEVAP